MAKNYALTWDPAAVTVQPFVTGGLASYGISSTTLKLRDEFDGTAGSAVNTSIWNYGEFWNALRWDAKVRDTNARLTGDGRVKLTITQANNGYGVELSSGWLESNQQFGPGTFFEWGGVILDDGVGHGHATVWTQTLNGMTDSGVTYPTPSDGCEVDFGEYAPGFGYQTNIISGGYGGNRHDSAIGFGTGSAAASHTYGLLWLPSGYYFFRDGTQHRSDLLSGGKFIGTNTDQVLRFVNEHDAGAGNECSAWADYARVWGVS
jgi:hypothetical protein